ncbi:MAG: hypothetical protein IKG23_03850 [Clostridia bacterium]|nr:hypothetical protein [Clostridia bacterium]
MKKLLSLILAVCLCAAAVSAFAEEGEEFRFYTEDNPEAIPFVSTWVAEDGNWRIEMYEEDGGIKPYIVHKLGDNKEDTWEYAVVLSEGKEKLTSFIPGSGLHYRQDTVSGEWDEVYYETGEAEFSLTEDGKLLWKDLKEDAGNGLEFEKIGGFFGGRWMKDEIEVIFYDWYEGEYDIRLYVYDENDNIVKDAILKGSYDTATDSLTATGEFEGEEPLTVTFSYDEHRNILWTENGESTVMDYSYRTD